MSVNRVKCLDYNRIRQMAVSSAKLMFEIKPARLGMASAMADGPAPFLRGRTTAKASATRGCNNTEPSDNELRNRTLSLKLSASVEATLRCAFMRTRSRLSWVLREMLLMRSLGYLPKAFGTGSVRLNDFEGPKS